MGTGFPGALSVQVKVLLAATCALLPVALYVLWCEISEAGGPPPHPLPGPAGLIPTSTHTHPHVADATDADTVPPPGRTDLRARPDQKRDTRVTAYSRRLGGGGSGGGSAAAMLEAGQAGALSVSAQAEAGADPGGPHAAAQEAPGWCPPLPLLSIIVSTNERLPRLLQWIRYHQRLGISLFYLFVEGNAAAPDAVADLRTLTGVKVFPPDERRAWWHAQDRIRHEWWLDEMHHKTCSGELVIRQVYNIEIGIHQARVDGASWLGHIDTDELLYPASSPTLSMHEVLGAVSPEVDSIMFPNYEAIAEHDHITDPMAEITLFKTALSHTDPVLRERHYDVIRHGNPTYFVAYDTGKSFARVVPGLRSNGPHLWLNYHREHTDAVHPLSGMFHYTFNRLSDLLSRRDRCECAPTQAGAEKCFWLEFDKETFLAASLKTEPELRRMFRQRLVWDDPELNADLVAKGLLARVHTPSLMLRLEGDPAETLPRRSAARQAADAAFRTVADTTVGNFTYADLRPGGAPASCEQFAAEDSSLTVLELVGPLPLANDTRDSDAVLVKRMYRYPGKPRAKVA